MIQSTGASNRIEGIFTSDKRLEELVSKKAEPRNRSEQEIAGYREVLSTIHEGYEYINPRPNIILQLHRDLYSYSQGATGGRYKNSDNVIAETDAEGHQKARFIPVPAFQTAEAMEELCTRFLEAWEANRIDKLVLIPMFILDFLCIHPFNDGNKSEVKEIPMRDFDFIVSPEKLLTPEIVQMVSSIHEHKGKQELFLEANVDELKTLLEVALVQSTGASNRIEGIFTSDKRLEELVSQKAEPRNRSEQEIAGYREVLSTIYEGYEYINPRPNIILQLH